MKYCLRSRVSDAYLRRADQIKVEYRDYLSLIDVFEKYPKAEVVLEMDANYNDGKIDKAKIKQFNILSKGRLKLCVADLSIGAWAKENNIPYYYGYPIKTYYDLRSLIKCGVCAVRLDAPLFFELTKVKYLFERENVNIEIRAVANVAYLATIPHENGICGTYIRPEDVDEYGKYINVIEFEGVSLKQEEALYRIYAQERTWPGELNDIILNFNAPATNRMIDDMTFRIDCEQSCQRPVGLCRRCYSICNLANPEREEDIKEVLQLSKKT